MEKETLRLIRISKCHNLIELVDVERVAPATPEVKWKGIHCNTESFAPLAKMAVIQLGTESRSDKKFKTDARIRIGDKYGVEVTGTTKVSIVKKFEIEYSIDDYFLGICLGTNKEISSLWAGVYEENWQKWTYHFDWLDWSPPTFREWWEANEACSTNRDARDAAKEFIASSPQFESWLETSDSHYIVSLLEDVRAEF